MKGWELWKLAWRNLRTGGLRSFLSVLGIVIGVAAVITLVSVGQGARMEITSQLTDLGSNLITVVPAVRAGSAGRLSAEQVSRTLTVELADEIAAKNPALDGVTPLLQTGGRLIYGARNLVATVIGVSPRYGQVLNYHPLIGRFLQAADDRERRPVVVLGFEVARELFGSEVPVGQEVILAVRSRRLPVRVVGVMEPKGAMFFSNFDRQVYLPARTLVARGLTGGTVGSYLTRARDGVTAETATAQLEFFFARRLGKPDQVELLSQQALLEAVGQATATMTLLLGAIAGIALLVGGIGIMNIMLVSVVERTHEIGVRMAIGARRKDISRQFLLEAVALSVTGGLIGLAVGWAGSYAVAAALGWRFYIFPQSVALAVGFSSAVGIFFGLYPARRAARLDPVEALRYE